VKYLPRVSCILVLFAIICSPFFLKAASSRFDIHNSPTLSTDVLWTSTKVEHVYGLPDIKHNKTGALTLTADALSFTGNSGDASISRSSITALSAGNQRVEIGGFGMRLVRMAIPDGGGLAAAAVMHHRIDVLTVNFRDINGGRHAAVFFLPAAEADRALQSFSSMPESPTKSVETVCQNSTIEPKSVLVVEPSWDKAQVPAAYRALVYEHLIDRLRRMKEISHVYRDGESYAQGECPQYTVRLSNEAFREGSSVERASLGPVGMFVGTTQMKFNVTFSEAYAGLETKVPITATLRGESESTDVADNVAKKITKQLAKCLMSTAKGSSAKATVNPAS
jgi:hypothetical protein